MPTQKVRMLVDHRVDGIPYPCNAVVEFESSLAQALVKDGVADDNKFAVEYARGGGQVIQHPGIPRDPAAVE